MNNRHRFISARMKYNRIKHKANQVYKKQFGFQKGNSTVDCIFSFYSIISKTLHAGEKLYCVFIDYEKAFDKIDRTFLWQKLISENISSKLVQAIISMYLIVKSCKILYKISVIQIRLFQFSYWIKTRRSEFPHLIYAIH